MLFWQSVLYTINTYILFNLLFAHSNFITTSILLRWAIKIDAENVLVRVYTHDLKQYSGGGGDGGGEAEMTV